MSTTRNDAEWREAAAAYIEARHALDDAKQAEHEARLTLLELTDTDARGAGVAVAFTERRGAVDYKRVLADVAPAIDVEPYRKKSTAVQKITIATQE